jgi:hypothetical protein
MTLRRLAIMSILLGFAGAACACGKVGYLEQPAPLYGEKAKAEYRARQAARSAAEAATYDGAPGSAPEALAPPEPGAATPLPAAPPPPGPQR